MTSRAFIGNARMIKCAYRPLLSAFMADITFLGGRNVVGSFTRCNAIVMTAAASSLYLAVIDNHYGLPCPRAFMTGIAFVAALDMAWTFPCRSYAVVASTTVTAYAAMVESAARKTPGRAFRIVAGVAGGAGWNMIWSFTLGYNSVMAAGAFRGRSLEVAFGVTGFAGDGFMSPFQGEAGFEMVEIGCDTDFSQYHRRMSKYCEKKQ